MNPPMPDCSASVTSRTLVMDPACTASFKGRELAFQLCTRLHDKLALHWSVHDPSNNGTLETLLVGKVTDGWIGIGWGYTRMVPSNSVVAYRNSTSSTANDYFAGYAVSSAVQPAGRQRLRTLETHASGDTLSVRFVRSLASPGGQVPCLNPAGKNNVIWAVGPPADAPTNLGHHLVRGAGTVDFGHSHAAHRGNAFFAVHGVLLAIAWILLVPLAVMFMRFGKRMSPGAFRLHRSLNGVAGVLTSFGFVMGVAAGSHTHKPHLVVGCVVFALTLLQLVGGLARPARGASWRGLWLVLHSYSGRAALALAVLNVYFGMELLRPAWWWYLIVSVAVGAFCVAFCVFSLMPAKFPIVESEWRDVGGNDEEALEISDDSG